MYTAVGRSTVTGSAWKRRYDDPETAARNLLVLLRAAGWDQDDDEAVQQLVSGATVRYRSFEYFVRSA